MANNRDVQLTIRAKNQASGAIESVSDALRSLEQAQQKAAAGGSDVAESLSVLGRGLAGLAAQNTKLAQSTETVSRALEKQQRAAVEANAGLRRRREDAAALTAQLKLLEREAAKAFIGPRRDGLSEQIRQIKGELTQANRDIKNFGQTFSSNISAIQQSKQALREIRRAQADTANATATFTAQIELQTQAQREAANAARQQADAQQFFNDRFAPGLNRGGNSQAQQQEIAAVLRVAEARDREIQGYRQEAAAVAQAERAQRGYNAILDQRIGKSARESARLFEESAQAAEREAAALARLRAQLNPTAEAERRLAQSAREVLRFRREGKITYQEGIQAIRLYRAELEKLRGVERQESPLDSRGRPTLFGLKPYEVQNLGFQINDIFTQLASGTSLTQTLAQQMGQIFQILPGIGQRVVAFITSPILIAGAAVAGTLIAALVRAGNEAERLRNVGAIITSIGNAAGTSAADLDRSAAALDRFGLSAEDAISSIRIFTRAGLNPERFVQFGLAARDMALVLGKDVPEAAKLLADGLTGGFEAVQRLQEETGVYTDAELERIRVLFESGEAEDARRLATEAATRSYQEAADKARGPWARAALQFESAWDKLISSLANSTVISGTVGLIGGLVEKVELLIRAGQTLTATEFFKWLTAGAGSVFTGQANPFRVPDAENPAGNPTGSVRATRSTAAVDRRLVQTIQTEVLADTEVRSRAILEQKLSEFRRRIRSEIKKDDRFRGASEAAVDAAVNARANRERIKLEEQLAKFQEQQANAAERKRKETAEAAKKAREPISAQEDLNARLDQEIAKRQQIASDERATFGLRGEALIQKERELAIAEAVRQEEERFAELNRNRVQDGKAALTLDQQRVQAIRDAAAAQFDAQNAGRVATERRRVIDEEVSGLVELRNSLEQRIAQLEQQGQGGQAQILRDQLVEVNGQLTTATQKAIEFYAALNPENNPFGLTRDQIAAIIQNLETARTKLVDFQIIAGVTATQFAQVFTGQAVSAIDQFAQSIASGENAFSSLGEAFLAFAANFLRQIAQMILQAIIFRAIMSALGGAFGGGSSTVSFSGPSATFHSGGIVGQGGTMSNRPLFNPALFAVAPRYHMGGIAGLKPNEVPAVLERGEEVLTADDPRHMANGGGSRPVTVINALDASDVMQKALGQPAGEETLLNFIRVNSLAIKGALG